MDVVRILGDICEKEVREKSGEKGGGSKAERGE